MVRKIFLTINRRRGPAKEEDHFMVLLTLKDAGAYLGVSQRTCRRMIDQGVLPFFKVGRLIRIARNDLETYLMSRRVEKAI